MMPARSASSRRRRRWLALALLVLGAAILPQRAPADDKLRQSSLVWKAVDNCTRAAAKAYPDYTAEALAKRAAHRRLCLRRSNLPDGDDAPPPPAASRGDAGK